MKEAYGTLFYIEINNTNSLPVNRIPNYMEFQDNGMGIMATGRWAFTTFDNWENIIPYEFTFPSSALLTPTVINDNKFYVADYDNGTCYILISNNGLDWERIKVGEFHAGDIYFKNNNIGYIAGQRPQSDKETSDDVIYKTYDGGLNWEKVLDQYNEPGSWGLFGITFINENIGIATSKTGLLYTTTDQGITWIYDEMDQVDQDIFITEVYSSKDRIFLLNNSITNMYVYDAGLLGITSVPIYNYKELNVYPNPFISSINFNMEGVHGGTYNIKIFNSNSELVFQENVYVSEGSQLNTDLPAGVYFLLLEGNEYYYKKIIKE